MTLDHHDEATALAMRVVARGLIADAVSEYATSGRRWQHLDDMDTIDVVNIALAMTEPPDDAEHAAAMEHLTKRGQR